MIFHLYTEDKFLILESSWTWFPYIDCFEYNGSYYADNVHAALDIVLTVSQVIRHETIINHENLDVLQTTYIFLQIIYFFTDYIFYQECKTSLS